MADSKLLLDFADTGGDFFKGRLNTIQCPVIFTASLKDSSIPDPGQQQLGMAQQIDKSTVVLKNAGDHPLMWTCPAQFRSSAQNFLIEFRGNKESPI
ncbi:MAG: alpha/beta hydrolase [Anaerolineales bacterium]